MVDFMCFFCKTQMVLYAVSLRRWFFDRALVDFFYSYVDNIVLSLSLLFFNNFYQQKRMNTGKSICINNNSVDRLSMLPSAQENRIVSGDEEKYHPDAESVQGQNLLFLSIVNCLHTALSKTTNEFETQET